MSAFTRKQLERRTGIARLKAEELVRSLETRRESVSQSRQADRSEMLSFIDEVVGQAGRLRETLNVEVGLTIAQAAGYLDVSKPTVRKWLREGLLERVDGRKPVEVTQGSVLRVGDILARLRESFPEREWTRALAAYLHDQSLMEQAWLREGVAAHRAGKLVEM